MIDTDFIFDERDSETDKPSAPLTKAVPAWNIRMIFSTEPALAMIAMEAAAAKWLWRKARISAFDTAMQEADKLIGEDACDPRLRHHAAWDVYHDFICDLLRL